MTEKRTKAKTPPRTNYDRVQALHDWIMLPSGVRTITELMRVYEERTKQGTRNERNEIIKYPNREQLKAWHVQHRWDIRTAEYERTSMVHFQEAIANRSAEEIAATVGTMTDKMRNISQVLLNRLQLSASTVPIATPRDMLLVAETAQKLLDMHQSLVNTAFDKKDRDATMSTSSARGAEMLEKPAADIEFTLQAVLKRFDTTYHPAH